MATNVILNSEYNIYANVFDNNIAKISYPTRNFYYNANCGNMFAECTTLQFNLFDFQGRFNYTTNMTKMFYNCMQITGQPIVGPNTTSLSMAYYQCQNLTGSPVCGEKVTNLSAAYYNCTNLTGNPVCEENVINMAQTYYQCTNLYGNPVCGKNVTNLSAAYYNCTNLTGNPVCGENVINMAQTYYNCTNLYGTPMNCENVVNLYATFYEIPNLYGNFYINYNGTSAVNGALLFTNRNKNNSITIHVKPNSLWNTWFHNIATINNATAFTWIDMPGRYVNTTFNTIVQYNENCYADIYLKNFNMYQIWGSLNYQKFKLNFYNDFYLTSNNYTFINIDNSIEYIQIDKNAGNCYLTGKLNKTNVFFNANMYQTFFNCQNITFLPVGLTNQLRFDYVTNAYRALYLCYNLNMNISNCNFGNVINLNQTFQECYSITGSPFSSSNVTDMYYAYTNCRNLTGIGRCGNNVKNFAFAYYGCSNINGAELGTNTTNIQYSYFYCNNLKSIICNRNAYYLYNIAFGGNNTSLNKVRTLDFNNCTNMYQAFYNVASLNNTVNIYIGDNVISLSQAFFNCRTLKGTLYGNINNVTSMYEAFYDCRQLKGPPICGDNVITMYNAYRHCHNLRGTPKCGNNVTNFWCAYQACPNITGDPVFGPKVQNIAAAYSACRNLIGNAVIPATVINWQGALYNCYKVSNIVFLKPSATPQLLCERDNFDIRRNVIVTNRYTFNYFRQDSSWTCCAFSAEEVHAETILVAGINYTSVRWAYNVERNTYLYCTE